MKLATPAVIVGVVNFIRFSITRSTYQILNSTNHVTNVICRIVYPVFAFCYVKSHIEHSA